MTSLSEALADRLDRALADSSNWRGAELQNVEGNPLAIDHRSFGQVRARRVGRELAYYRYFSGPLDALTGHEAVVPALAEWYAGAPCFVRVSPRFANEDLSRSLAAAGLAQTGFINVLFSSLPSAQASTADDVTVVEVGPDHDQTFLDLWTNEAPDSERALQKRLARAEFTHWRQYVAFVDDQPAAHAAMFISSETRTAVMAAAGTLEALRGRGCQSALVHRRMADAALAACDLVAVETSPGSASQRNLERLGFRVAMTRAFWELPPNAAV